MVVRKPRDNQEALTWTATLPARMDSMMTSLGCTPAEAAICCLYRRRKSASNVASANAVMERAGKVTWAVANTISTAPAKVGLVVGAVVDGGGGLKSGGDGGGGDGGGRGGGGDGRDGGGGDSGSGGEGGGGEQSPVLMHDAGGGLGGGGGLGRGGLGGGGLGGGGEGGGGEGRGGGDGIGGGMGATVDSSSSDVAHTMKPVFTTETSLVKNRELPAETVVPPTGLPV